MFDEGIATGVLGFVYLEQRTRIERKLKPCCCVSNGL